MLITDVTAGAGVGVGAAGATGVAARGTGFAGARLWATFVVAVRLALERRCLEAASAGPAANGTAATARVRAARCVRLKTVRSGVVTPPVSAAARVSATPPRPRSAWERHGAPGRSPAPDD